MLSLKWESWPVATNPWSARVRVATDKSTNKIKRDFFILMMLYGCRLFDDSIYRCTGYAIDLLFYIAELSGADIQEIKTAIHPCNKRITIVEGFYHRHFLPAEIGGQHFY